MDKIIFDAFYDNDDIIDITMPLKDFEHIINNGIEQNIEFFEKLSKRLLELKYYKNHDKEEIN